MPIRSLAELIFRPAKVEELSVYCAPMKHMQCVVNLSGLCKLILFQTIMQRPGRFVAAELIRENLRSISVNTSTGNCYLK